MDNTLNLERVPKELTFILDLMKEDNDRNKELLNADTDIDWDLFIELVIHHRLFPIIHSKIKMINENAVPDHVSQALSNLYKANTFQMLQLTAEMELVHNLFLKHQIRTLFLKGPIVAQALYGDLSLRTSCDLDFLIPIQQLNQAEELLLGLGYEKDDYIQTVLNDWRWRHHHVTYIHPKKRIKLEVHWRLNPGPSKEPSFDELWQRRSKSELTSSAVSLLGKEDLFLFLVSHGARHGWSRLRWLVDILQLAKQKVAWEKVQRLSKAYDNPHVIGQAIILTEQLLYAEITTEMKSLISGNRPKRLAQDALFYLEDMIHLHTDPVPENISKYHTRYLFSLMSFMQKTFFITSFLYPYPEDAQTLPLPKRFHFLYFPLRPFLWIWRKTRKHALS